MIFVPVVLFIAVVLWAFFGWTAFVNFRAGEEARRGGPHRAEDRTIRWDAAPEEVAETRSARRTGEEAQAYRLSDKGRRWLAARNGYVEEALV